MTENTVLDNNTSSIIKKEGIPKLRFPEFDTLWRQISFNDIFDILQNNTYARADLNYKIENTKNIHYGDILVKFNEYVDVQNNNVPFINSEKNLSKFKSESYLRDGDIIVADTAEDETVGKVTEISNTNEQKVLSGLHTIPCRPKRKFAPMFLGFYMNSESFHKQLIPLITGIKVSSISKTSIATTTISVPLFEEQEKISKFMIAINNMIKEQESNISILETYNRGLKMDILSQKIRFKDDSGNQYPDWEKAKLDEVFIERNTTQTITSDAPLLSFTIEDGVINPKDKKTNKRDFLIKDIDNKKFSLTEYNDIIYNPANLKFGAIHRNKLGRGVVSPIYAIFYTKENPVFMEYVVTNPIFIKKSLKYLEGTVIKLMTLKPKDFLLMDIYLPCLEEQEKIANFLTSLDNVLQEEKNYLEYLKTIKKGLLQQMFV